MHKVKNKWFPLAHISAALSATRRQLYNVSVWQNPSDRFLCEHFCGWRRTGPQSVCGTRGFPHHSLPDCPVVRREAVPRLT